MLHSQIKSLWYLSSHRSFTDMKVRWTDRLTDRIDRHDEFIYASLKTYALASVI